MHYKHSLNGEVTICLKRLFEYQLSSIYGAKIKNRCVAVSKSVIPKNTNHVMHLCLNIGKLLRETIVSITDSLEVLKTQ